MQHQCSSCGSKGYRVRICNKCGEIRCYSGSCTGKTGQKGGASLGGKCKACGKGTYKEFN